MISKGELTFLGVGCLAVAALLAAATVGSAHVKKYYSFATAKVVKATASPAPAKDTFITSVTFPDADGKVVAADGIVYKAALNGGKVAAPGVTFPVRFITSNPALTVMQDSDHLSVKIVKMFEHPLVYGVLAAVFAAAGVGALVEANSDARKVASATYDRAKEFVKRRNAAQAQAQARAPEGGAELEEAFW